MKILFKAASVVAALALVGGCSANSGNTDAEPNVDEGQEVATNEAALKAAEDFLEQFETRPENITITEPLGVPVPAEGEIYFVQCGAPACVALGDALEDATNALGWKLKRLQGGLSAETIKDAWAQAANANPAPSGVIGSGFDENIIEAEVKALADKGVPAISISSNDPTPVVGNLAASLGPGIVRNGTIGAMQAASIIKDGKGASNAVYVYSPTLESTIPQAEGFEKKYKELCPDCEVDMLQVSPNSIGTTLPEEITSYLQAHPDVTHVGVAFGDMGVGLPAALKAAGMEGRVKANTDTPGITVSSYMAEGETFFSATAYQGQEFIWTAVDVILRHQLGLDTSPSANAEIVHWLITPETLPSSTEEFPVVEDYQEQFLKLWGIN